MSGIPASRCDACAVRWVPPRPWCPACGGPVSAADAPPEGCLASWTVVHAAPAGFTPGYVVGAIDLDGTLVTARGDSEDGLAVGARVHVREDADGHLRFRLA